MGTGTELEIILGGTEEEGDLSVGRVNIQTEYGGDLAAAFASDDDLLYAPPGTYNHSTALNIRSKDVIFDRVTLNGTVGTNAAIIISGVSPRVRFAGTCYIERPQWTTTDTYAVEGAGIAIGSYGWATTNAVLIADNLFLEDVWQTGVFVHDTTTATISGGITNTGSGRDSFHTTGGSTDIDWQAQLHAIDSGDDGAAVVSYWGEAICERVRYRHVVVSGDQLNGRGITCVGGKDCQVDYANVQNTAAAGVYVACEDSYGTHGVDGWTVLAVRVRNPNTAAIHDKNCIVYSGVSGREVKNVSIVCDRDTGFGLYSIAPGAGSTSNISITEGTVN